MPSNTAKYVIPYPLASDTVASVAATVQNLAARTDLLLGESGAFVQSGAAGATVTQAIVLSRTYPGSNVASIPGIVLLNHNQTLAAATGFNFWVTAWTGSATTITGFTLNLQFSAVWASRNFLWRFLPVL